MTTGVVYADPMGLPVMSAHNKKNYRFRWWWVALTGLTLVVIIALSILNMNINSIAHTQIHKLLNTYLAGGGSLDAIDVELAEGRVEVKGFTINSRQQFGSTPLLHLETLVLDVKLISLLVGSLTAEELVLKDLSIVVIRDDDGNVSVQNIVKPGKADAEPDTEPPVDPDEGGVSIPSIGIDSIRLENIRISLIDGLSKQQWSSELQLDLALDDLQLRDVMQGDILCGKIMFALSGLRVDQPPGFDMEPFAGLDRLEILSDGLDFGAPEMVIESVRVKGPSLSLIVQEDGASNWQRLGQIFGGSVEEPDIVEPPKEKPGILKRLISMLKGRRGKADEQITEVAPNEPSAETKRPVIMFEKARLEDGALTYQNDSLPKKGIALPIKDIELNVSGLRLFDTREESPPASVSGSFALSQPEDHPTAYLGLLGAIGHVGVGFPLINAQVRVTGFKLDTLGAMVPSATRKAIGATGLDADIGLAVNTESLHLNSSILTDRNVKYNTIKITGPLNAPKVQMDKILLGVVGRLSGGIFRLGKDSIHAGADIASGGVEVTKGLGSAALNIGKSILKGARGVGAGVVTWDKEQIKSGFTDSTSGTVVVTVDSARNVGSSTVQGGASSYSSLKGGARLNAWNQGIPERHEAAMERAQNALETMPYPPVTE